MEEGAESVAKKSSELIEVSKINLEISSEEKKAYELYAKIGRKIYKRYMEGKEIDKDLISKCKEIEDIESDIKELEEKRLRAKEMKNCKHCYCEMKAEDSYCPRCGKKQ
jgi:hypothetical protein